jgi:hypothetical protein
VDEVDLFLSTLRKCHARTKKCHLSGNVTCACMRVHMTVSRGWMKLIHLIHPIHPCIWQKLPFLEKLVLARKIR